MKQRPTKTAVRFRAWKRGVLAIDETHLIDDPNECTPISERHAAAVADEPHMIEIEFLDEPDPMKRFFRFGTDPEGMVEPHEIDLADERAVEKALRAWKGNR